jgi:hypothetical protein
MFLGCCWLLLLQLTVVMMRMVGEMGSVSVAARKLARTRSKSARAWIVPALRKRRVLYGNARSQHHL